MKTLVLALMVLVWHPAVSALHPFLVDPSITSCDDRSGRPCSEHVYYVAAGLVLADTAPLTPPLSDGGTALQAVGVHCENGDLSMGVPFRTCRWTVLPTHTPTIAGCQLIDAGSWELDRNATCQLTVNTWGMHTGAGPGGECIMFVQKGQKIPNGVGAVIRTIYGDLTADIVANAGSSFCQKPLPPAQKCDIDLPGIIDHGEGGTEFHSEINVEGTIDCGVDPVLTVVGGSVVSMGPGVTSNLTLQILGMGRVGVTSVVDTTNASPGDYSVSRVVIASPY